MLSYKNALSYRSIVKKNQSRGELSFSLGAYFQVTLALIFLSVTTVNVYAAREFAQSRGDALGAILGVTQLGFLELTS